MSYMASGTQTSQSSSMVAAMKAAAGDGNTMAQQISHQSSSSQSAMVEDEIQLKPLLFPQNRIRTIMKKTTTSKGMLMGEPAIIALNLFAEQFITKLTHDATVASLKIATQNNQKELPLHVGYEHLAIAVRDKDSKWPKHIHQYLPPKVTYGALKQAKIEISSKVQK